MNVLALPVKRWGSPNMLLPFILLSALKPAPTPEEKSAAQKVERSVARFFGIGAAAWILGWAIVVVVKLNS